MSREEKNSIEHWLASIVSSELAVASLIGSVADKIDKLDISNADTLKLCNELRLIVTEVMNLATERQKWIFQTIGLLIKNQN